MQTNSPTDRFVVCVKNEGYPAALEVRKLYRVLPDDEASVHQMLRIVDESGEDYLYPAAMFLPLDLPPMVREALSTAA